MGVFTSPRWKPDDASTLFLESHIFTVSSLVIGENISGQTKRAVGVAMQIAIGDVGAVTRHGRALLYRMPHIIE